jgi:hypothetical protein
MITVRACLTEAGVLGVFLLGLLVSRSLGRRWHVTEIAMMYVIGLLFEILTAYWWTYRNIFILLPIPINRDISALFPLGWAGLNLISASIAERFWDMHDIKTWWKRHGVLMAVWLIVGSISEATFNAAGMMEYVDRPTRRLLLGQLPNLPPTIYMVGYAFLPPVITQFFRWMERGLARTATERAL